MNNTENKRRGRKINPSLTKLMYLDANTMIPLGRGRPNLNKKIVQISVQRNVKASEFNFKTTPFTSLKEIAPISKPRNSVSVTVIEPENMPEVKAEIKDF